MSDVHTYHVSFQSRDAKRGPYIVRICSLNTENNFNKSINYERWITSDRYPDIICIGLQEVYVNIKDFIAPEFAFNNSEAIVPLRRWVDHFNTIKMLRDNYNLLTYKSCGGLSISIYTRKYNDVNHKNPLVTNLLVGYVPLGTLKLANKGAVSISFRFEEISVCFINCHLPAGEGNFKSRQQSFQSVIQQLKLYSNNQPKSKHVQLIDAEFDAVFLFGDLNFRLRDISPKDVVLLIGRYKKQTAIVKLKELDELLLMKNQDAIYKLFNEAEIEFYPTYKFIANTNNYNLKRIPSYTDRILWFGNNCVNITYNSHPEVNLSDHKPISGDYLIDLGKDKRHPSKYRVQQKSSILTLDNNILDFGDIEFLMEKVQTLNVTNIGPNTTDVSIKFGHLVNVPEWLIIIPNYFKLESKHSEQIYFRIFINHDHVSHFNYNINALFEIRAFVSYANGIELPLRFKGVFKRNIFGLSLHLLRVIDRPPYQYKCSEIKAIEESSKHSKIGSDDLLIQILDVLLPNIQSNLTFNSLVHGEISNTEHILSIIDLINSLPGRKNIKLKTYSLITHVEAFLLFVKSLPQSLIPYVIQARLTAKSLTRGLIAKAVSQLPRSNYLIFRKMMYFFHNVNIQNKKLIAGFLCSVIKPASESMRNQLIQALTFIIQSPDDYCK